MNIDMPRPECYDIGKPLVFENIFAGENILTLDSSCLPYSNLTGRINEVRVFEGLSVFFEKLSKNLNMLPRLVLERGEEFLQEFVPLALEHSSDKDPQVRGYAALALRAAGGADAEALLEGLAGDSEDFLYYDGRDLCQLHVSDAARFSPKDYLL